MENAFASTIPLPEEVIGKYKEGFCDQDPNVGNWLEANQSQLDLGGMEPVLAFFLLPNTFPRILGACLLNLISPRRAETVEWTLLFFDDFAYLTVVEKHNNEDSVAKLSREITSTQALLAIIVLARSVRRYSEHLSSPDYTAGLGNFFFDRACEDSTCVHPATRALDRLNERLVRLRSEP